MIPRIAIDFGTHNSVLAYYNGRAPEVIKVEGSELTPSVVTIAGDKVFIGKEAQRLGPRYPDSCYKSFKRHLAKPFHDEEDAGEHMVAGPDGTTHYQGPGGHTYSPTELAGWILGKFQDAAAKKFGGNPERAVVCVPATFKLPQRRAIEEAARQAGFTDIYLIDEPTAAAIAYGYNFEDVKRVAVVDVGAGTTDIAFIETGGGRVEILATNGTSLVGGDDWDKLLGGYVVNLWETEHGDDLAVRDRAMQLILDEAELAKRRLTDNAETEFRIEDITKDRKTGADLHMIYPVSQTILNELTKELIKSIRDACQRTVDEAKSKDPRFTVKDLDVVILVGGMTRVPAIQAMVADFFKQAPKTEIDPEIAVALGAAVQAGVMDGRRAGLKIKNITPHSFAIETHDKVEGVATVLVPKGTPYPWKPKVQHKLANREAGQTALSIRLLQGESERASDCVQLDAADIEIEPGDPREVKIPVSFEIDESGNLIFEAGDYSFGRDAA